MADVALSEFLPLVLPWAPGCPYLAVRGELIRAAQQFCEETGVWKNTPAAIDVIAATHTYAVPAPTGAQCVVIEEAYYDGLPLEFKTPVDLRLWHSDWLTATGTPRYATQTDPDNIRLVPIPETADALTDGLTLRIVCKPLMSATTLPGILFHQYGHAVAAGALARLLSVPGKAWSNPQLADYYHGRFGNGITAAKVDASKAFSMANRSVRQKFI